MASKRKFFTGHVHLMHEFAVVSFAPGDEVPDWADKLVTNPDAFEIRELGAAPVVPVAPTGVAEAGDDLDGLKAAELKVIAKEVGVPAKGKVEDLKAAIRAKRAEATPEPAQADAAGRAALEARAKEQGIEFDENTTEEELETLLDGGQE